jgi:hypothetical protein
MTVYRQRLLIAGLFVFLLTLLVNFPADQLFNLFRGRIPESVSWQQVSGTIFRPVFHQVNIRLANGRRLQLDSVDISFSPLQILPGANGLKTEVVLAGGRTVAWVKPGMAQLQINSLEGDLQLQGMAGLTPLVGGLGISGHIRFNGDALAVDYQGLPQAGELEISITDLMLKQLDASGPLGDYTTRLQVVDGIIQGNIGTSSANAPLRIQGQLQVDIAGRTAGFNGEASVSDSASSSLYGILPLLGPIEAGRARINWQTRL